MTQLRKTLKGYDVTAVNQHIRNFKFYSERELSELQHLITKAQKERSFLLQNLKQSESKAMMEQAATIVAELQISSKSESISFKADMKAEVIEAVEEVDVVIEEISVEVVKEQLNVEIQVELIEEISLEMNEVIENESSQPAPVQSNKLHKENVKMGRLLTFRRKMDSSSDMNVQSSESSTMNPSVDRGFWDNINHYMITPETAEDYLSTHSELTNALPQTQFSSNSAVGMPRYFDYNITETQPQINIDYSQVRERRVRDNTQESLKIKIAKSKESTQETSNIIAPRSNYASAAQGSKEISREVRQLRNKYIIGKWAGQDLLNKDGKLIAAKNSPITETIIDEADQEGMLALLIVHMTIPGLEEGD